MAELIRGCGDKKPTLLLGLGSNQPHGRYGAPPQVLRAALSALAGEGVRLCKASRIYHSRPMGPSARRYANMVALMESDLAPPQLLALLKNIERRFGRKKGRRWGARVLDLDILAMGQLIWPDRANWASARDLAIPHHGLPLRDFVLTPILEVAPGWKHPIFGLSARQMHYRLTRARRPIDDSKQSP